MQFHLNGFRTGDPELCEPGEQARLPPLDEAGALPSDVDVLIVEIVNKFAPHTLPWPAHLYETKDTGVPYDIGFYLGLVGSPLAIFRGWGRRG